MLRRVVIFVLAFAIGYRAAYVAVDAAGRAALSIPWRDSPRLLAGGATSVVRGRLTEARLAIEEGKQAARDREHELRVENHLRQSS